MPSIYPTIRYDDAQAAVEFLTTALGFEQHAIHETEDGKIAHAELRHGDGMVMLGERTGGDDRFDTGRAVTYVVVQDPDALHDHAKSAGAENEPDEYKAKQPNGRAFLHGAEYTPPHEEPDADYPLSFTTGRTIYHWHTRTRTARTPQLEHAAPSVWVEICPGDARQLGLIEGDLRERVVDGEVAFGL